MDEQEAPINQKKEMKHILSLLLEHKLKLSKLAMLFGFVTVNTPAAVKPVVL